MDELLIQIRKIEAIFLFLFPKKWQDPPPSYRLIHPLLKRLAHYEKRSPWISALLYSIREGIYPAYHQKGFIPQLSRSEIGWMRFVLTVVLITLLMAFIGKTDLLSPWIKGLLLLGSSVLFIYGAISLSISAFWLTWGFLFPIINLLALGIAPGAMVFLALWGVLWHIPVVEEKRSWHWIDGLCTLPTLFFWIYYFSRILHSRPFWQTSLLSLGLWLLIWIVLIRGGGTSWLSKTGQFFWPASLALVTIIGWIKPELAEIYQWSLWLLGTLGLSLGISALSNRIATWSSLFRWQTIMIVFTLYGLWIGFSGTSTQLKEAADTGLLQIFNSLELLWWIVGAGIILSVREATLLLLKWVGLFLSKWILPLILWVIPLLAYGLGWLPPFMVDIGKFSVLGLWVVFAMGVTLFSWRKKENLLREWMFWGFFIFFLLDQYYSDIRNTIELYWSQPHFSAMGFVTLAIWLLWLNYYSVGKYLNRLKEKAEGIRPVALMGALLWLFVAIIWMGYVDQQFSIRGRITFDLFKGFTLLGIPLIIYHLIARHYFKLESSPHLPWGWILVFGIGLTQILQGAEHWVGAWMEGKPFDVLQKELYRHLLSGAPLNEAAPSWVMNPSWIISWRSLRWVGVMMILTWMIHRDNKREWHPLALLLTICLASHAVWTAEGTWLFWPSMPLEWAVILRPWMETKLLWNVSSLKLYALYLTAGILWGWVLYQWKRKRGDHLIPNTVQLGCHRSP